MEYRLTQKEYEIIMQWMQLQEEINENLNKRLNNLNERLTRIELK